MLKHSLEIMPRAKEDIIAIFDYISNTLHNETAASNLMNKFDSGFEQICNHPNSCPLARTEPEYRKLIVDNYIAFYKVDNTNKKSIVFRVLHGMMNYDKYL